MRRWMSHARWIALTLAALPSLGAGAPPDAVQALSWMAGTWTGAAGGVETEELWTAPKGGSLLGLHRDVANGRTVSFEFFRIEASPAGTTFWASPGGKAPVPFRLISSADRRVVFENSEHDFPTRILYWRATDGSLHARIEGTQGGKAVSEEWSWRKTR